MRRLIVSLFCIVSVPVLADQCEEHIQFGVPMHSDLVLCKGGFVVGYSLKHRIPDWSAYKMTKESVSLFNERSNRFKADSDVAHEGSASLSNYARSGFDRGHIAPAASIDIDNATMEESFELSNIAPQLPGLNRNGWKILERDLRDLAVEYGTVYVVSGTHGSFRRMTPALASTQAFKEDRIRSGGLMNGGLQLDGEVTIPAYFYKGFYIPSINSAGVYIVPHQAMDGESAHTYLFTLPQAKSLLQLSLFDSINPTFFNDL